MPLSDEDSRAAFDAGYEWASANKDKARALLSTKAKDAVFMAVCEEQGWTHLTEDDDQFWDWYTEILQGAEGVFEVYVLGVPQSTVPYKAAPEPDSHFERWTFCEPCNGAIKRPSEGWRCPECGAKLPPPPPPYKDEPSSGTGEEL